MKIRFAMAAVVALAGLAAAQLQGPNKDEERILHQLRTLRTVADDRRPGVTRELAAAIRNLAVSEVRVSLASTLANLSTEGDAGRETLQAVGDTLAQALADLKPAPGSKGKPGRYEPLARLARYEGVRVTVDDPEYREAIRRFEETDRQRERAMFSLKDLNGKNWALKDLRGKVVLMNFWATWCPPCRKEMPDMEALSKRFQERGLVVLAISDEEEGVVRKYIRENPYSYPILLDRDKATAKRYAVGGIPVSFVYDREGKLVATAVDQRTERQFLEMMGKAGLQ